MFLRATTRKNADGTAIRYLQLAESQWNPEKQRSETKVVYSFGRADHPETETRLRQLARSILKRCSPEELVEANKDWRLIDTWPYGDLYALEQLWKRLHIPETIEELTAGRKFEFDLERALFALVANRCLAPASKLYAYEQWLQHDVRIEGCGDLGLHHLYRSMDFLLDHKEQFEQAVFFRLGDLLNLDVQLVFYDTTSLHFECDPVQDGDTSDESSKSSLLKRGYSKNNRTDTAQIVVGLAVTRDGFPVKHWVWPGNTVDVKTIEEVKADLRGWRLTRCVFVSDAGTVSEENLRVLAGGGGKYIVCMPCRAGDEVTTQVLSRKGRYQEVAENLGVKEVWVGEGERRRRYVLCHNPLEQKRQRKHREQLLGELEAELASLGQGKEKGHSKRLCELRSSRRYGAYLRETKGGLLRIDRAKVKERERRDGKFVVHSNDDSLSAEDLALGYKQLMRAEEAWRTLKSGLEMRPVYHWSDHRIRGHVALCVMGLLLERLAEKGCDDTWRNIRDDLKQIKLAQLSTPDGDLWQSTAPRTEAQNRLRSLEITNPPTILKHA